MNDPVNTLVSTAQAENFTRMIFLATVKTTVKTAVKTTVKTTVKTPDRILRLLEQNPNLTLGEVAAEIGKSLSLIEKAAAKLRQEGKLKYVGPQKGGHWEVLPSE